MPSTAVYSTLQPLPFCAWRIGTHLQFEFEFDWARLNSGRQSLWLLTMESPSLNRQESANAAGVGI